MMMRVGEIMQVFSADRWCIRMMGLDCMAVPQASGSWMTAPEGDLAGSRAV